MNNVGFAKTMKNVRKNTDINLATTERSIRIIQYQNQIIILQRFSHNIHTNGKNTNMYE